MLAPGGLLLLLEGTRALRWVDLTFGLTDGWWRFEDTELRPEHALLAERSWIELLGAQGFAEATAVTPEHSGQAVILARAAQPMAATSGDQWLIFADAGGVGEALAAEIGRANENVVVVTAGRSTARINESRWQTTPEPAAIGKVLAELDPPAGRRRAVFLWGLDEPAGGIAADTLLAAQEHGSAGALALAQSLAGQHAELWLVTRGAQPAGPIARPAAVGQAAIWGLGRVIALEHPELWAGLIDLAPDAADDITALLAELRSSDGEDQIALRGAERLVPRLERATLPVAGAPDFRRDGSYLISRRSRSTRPEAGILARRKRRRSPGAHRPARASRAGRLACARFSGRQARQAGSIRAIEALGAAVTIEAVDVAESKAMTGLFARFGTDLPPLRGVFHAAAALGNRAVSELAPAELLAMLRPKLAGGWLLHELSRAHELDAFVLFSSTTALWGSRDLAHYAAANQTLDALAHYRRGLGLPALSINWGTWDEMRVASEAEQQVVAGYGLAAWRPIRHSRSWAPCSRRGLLRWRRRRRLGGAQTGLRGTPPASAAGPHGRCAAPAGFGTGPHGSGGRAGTAASPGWRHRPGAPTLIGDFVRESVARALGISQARQIDDRQGLFELGMDSLMSVELKGRLERSVGRTLPSTLTFNYPSVAALAGFFTDELLAEPTAEPIDEAAPVPMVAQPVEHDELSEDDLEELSLRSSPV